MKLKTLVAGAIDAGGNWGIEVPAFDVLRLNVVLKGNCWLSIESEKKHYQLKTGDCFLLPHAKSFVLQRDLVTKKRFQAEKLIRTGKNGVITCNGGGDFLAVGSAFQLEGHLPKIIFGRLPSLVHIPAHLDQAAVLRWSLERFAVEFQNPNVGRSLMLSHLAPIMLLQALRIYLASAKDEENWFSALSDPKLSKAIGAMHSDYRRDWSLVTLAKVAGVSRAGFALNFKKRVGVAPMEYLTQWRMQIACELLQEGDQGIAEVADAVGYESESAFSVAFKKVVHCRPGLYQRNHNSRASESLTPRTVTP
jgi:AraC-like DNA-binding protein